MLQNIYKRAFSTAGSLLTWGETTYGWGRPVNKQLRNPNFVEGFNNVTSVSTGPYHMAFLTSNKEIYTVGLGDNGRLGNNSQTTEQSPTRLDYFSSNKISISQLACGYRHTLALSEDGNVYSWGYGGGLKYGLNFLTFLQKASPLGHGVNADCHSPKLISTLQGANIKAISAGKDFSLALSSNGILYGWGQGLNKVLNQDASSIPQQLEAVTDFCQHNHTKIKKIASAHKSSLVLFDNGKLYAFGTNMTGATGTRQNPLVITDRYLAQITKVIDQDFKGQKVTDFKLSGNSLIFQTDANRIYYSGMYAKFRPARFPIQATVQKIFATYDSVGVIDSNNQTYYLNDQFIDNSDKNNDVFTCQDQKLEKVIDIGGTYKLRYALVRN